MSVLTVDIRFTVNLDHPNIDQNEVHGKDYQTLVDEVLAGLRADIGLYDDDPDEAWSIQFLDGSLV